MLILEESEPVASDNGWTMTVRIDQIDQTPRGSRNVLKSASYNFKAGAENETAEARRKRLDVKRGARQRAFDSFEPEKLAAKKLKRRKQQNAPAAATVALQPVALPRRCKRMQHRGQQQRSRTHSQQRPMCRTQGRCAIGPC